MKFNKIMINKKDYINKVYGCWLGKNAGGTLGEPLEKRFGQEEMFDISWYPELPEEGLPNDDLEIQLIWLQALQERGPGIKSRDLAEYWLDCIAYNFDEYGLHKTNLNKGLMPPVSGWYNNWFKDCMGSPIRSEIWACIAPGAPEVAARYAFEDSICDHAGGESVYGEIFNAVVESAAFVISDKFKLIEIGLNAIPGGSETYQAINKVVELFKEEVDWIEARNIIKNKFYNPIAQYSPINLAFQTIGWLYGENFGDAICKAVNCGWDTDCTGATLGAILGIIMGADELPEKWLEPLGDEISTNFRTGGIKNLEAPVDLNQLTAEVAEMGERVLKYWNTDIILTDDKTKVGSTFGQNLDLSDLLSYEPNIVNFNLNTLDVTLKYNETPAVVGDKPIEFSLKLTNPHPEAISTEIEVNLPEKWDLKPEAPVKLKIGPKSQVTLSYSVVSPANNIKMSNKCSIKINVEKRPGLLSVPLVFAGGFHWLASPVFVDKNLEDDCGMDESLMLKSIPEGWRDFWRTGNDLDAEKLFDSKSGVVYLTHFIKSEQGKKVNLGVPNNSQMKLWLNGEFNHQTARTVSLAPNEGGDGSNYTVVDLKKGWNQVMIKLERDNKAVEAHFLASGTDERYPINRGDGLINVNRAQFSWEER